MYSMTETPCEERGIPVMFGNFELEALERLTALSIQCWQVDVEDAKEAVRLVLHAGRLAVRRPSHALRDRRIEDALLPREKCRGYPRALADERAELVLRPDRRPFRRQEDEQRGREQLLQRPAARVPARPPEARARRADVVARGDVVEERVADLGEDVPVEHGVDRLGELRAACLVDAARVDPDPDVAIALCDETGISDLIGYEIAWDLACLLAPCVNSLDLLKCLLRDGLTPGVGEDGVALLHGARVGEVVEFGAASAKEPHGRYEMSEVMPRMSIGSCRVRTAFMSKNHSVGLQNWMILPK